MLPINPITLPIEAAAMYDGLEIPWPIGSLELLGDRVGPETGNFVGVVIDAFLMLTG